MNEGPAALRRVLPFDRSDVGSAVRGLTAPILAPVRTFLSIPSQARPLVAAVVSAGLLSLVLVSVNAPREIDVVRVFFWVALTFSSAAVPVRLPGGVVAHTTTTPIFGAIFDSLLPHPFAIAWIAFVGTTEVRDLRRQVIWFPFATLYNRSAYLLSALAGWGTARVIHLAFGSDHPVSILTQVAFAGLAFSLTNMSLAVALASARTGQPARRVWALSISNVLPPLVAQVPLGWLMAEVAVRVGLWAAFIVVLPLQLARYSLTRYTEIRELFYGSVSALSQAIDAKDGFTRGHADRVSRIAGAIAREMGLSEREIEQIELAALLHDIGKIGVEDRILMKPSRLEPDEKALMQRHSIYGAAILEPSVALRPLVPLVRHHHESYDGSGYPDGLQGEQIPLGSRVIIVADAYEAMTSDRIYRKAIGHERAMEQLHKYNGVQFDPKVVRALEGVWQKRGPAAFEVSDLPAIEYETLAELRRRLADQALVKNAHAG